MFQVAEAAEEASLSKSGQFVWQIREEGYASRRRGQVWKAESRLRRAQTQYRERAAVLT